MASVIGLAAIRPGLKDRLIELLCIHGQEKWSVGMLECSISTSGCIDFTRAGSGMPYAIAKDAPVSVQCPEDSFGLSFFE